MAQRTTTCTKRLSLLASLLALAAGGGFAWGQVPQSSVDTLGLGNGSGSGAVVSHMVLPQVRSVPLIAQAPSVVITRVDAAVALRDGVATTTVDISLANGSPMQAEAIVLLPVPDGATVRGFQFQGTASEGTAEVLPRDRARQIYDEIVGRSRDPALVEFAGYNLLRTSVFPVPAMGQQRVRVVYDLILECDGGRYDYRLPRSESLRQSVPWTIDITIESSAPVSLVYSPSHELKTIERSPARMRLALDPRDATQPGPFILSYAVERGPGTATALLYPDPAVGGGFFLLLASAGRADGADTSKTAPPREVTLVLDRSGSMAGGKMDQARGAALQVIEGLADGEKFNIIDYSTAVELFSPAPMIKDTASTKAAREYIAAMRPNGGTNIHDALVEALRQPTTGGGLPMVLFLTDGLPTVGQTSEAGIRKAVELGNACRRRVFCFGVGEDVNVPLLDRISDDTRASATYVLPSEDIELRVAQVFRKLTGPQLWDISLESTRGIAAGPRPIRDVEPRRIPDVFAGDQVVLLGQYRGEDLFDLTISGTAADGPWQRTVAILPSTATTKNAFVPRLWATRRIAGLIDDVRQMGASSSAVLNAPPVADDPRTKELVEEIVRLSTTYGVLTEYTAFLAREGTNLGDWEGLVRGCGKTLQDRAVSTRSGLAALNQGVNFNESKSAQRLNPSNSYFDQDMRAQGVQGCQQVSDRALFNNGGLWIDSRLANRTDTTPDETVEFGSARHLDLIHDLARLGRQGMLSQCGETCIEHEGKSILVLNPDC